MMMKVPKFLCVLVQVLLLLLRSTRCHGWGTIGHEVVANVAWAALSAEARTWVTLLLSSNGTSSFPATTTIRHANDQDASNSRATTLKTIQQEDNSPLGEVADWADQVRHYLPWSAPLHYIDVRDDLLAHGCHVDPALNPQCRFLYERDCPDDTCVAGAIVNYTHQLLLPQHWNQQQSLLRGTRPFQPPIGGSKATKEALMFLTHFIGDIHQPLHCSRLTDKGGNDIHVHFHLSTASHCNTSNTPSHHPHNSWNLHSVWDSGLVELAVKREYNNSRRSLEQHLVAQLDAAQQKYLHDCDPALGANRTCTILWGQESWEEAVRFAYTLPDNRTDVTDGATLDEDYFQTRWPLAKERLLAGAVRLAGTLEWLVQQSNTTAAATATTSIDNFTSPSFWSTQLSRSRSWTWKSRMLALASSYL